MVSDIHGDTGRGILETLRTVTAPLSTAAICEVIDLSQELPQAVDKLTPNGHVPGAQELETPASTA